MNSDFVMNEWADIFLWFYSMHICPLQDGIVLRLSCGQRGIRSDTYIYTGVSLGKCGFQMEIRFVGFQRMQSTLT